MNRSTDHGSCEAIRELIPWAATRHLAPEERERVESHAAACPACAELLAFVREVALQTGGDGQHPPVAVLVRLVEGTATADERRRWDDHMTRCGACRATRDALQRADRDLVPPADGTMEDPDTPVVPDRPSAVPNRRGGGRWRAAWTALPVAAMLLLALVTLTGRRAPGPGPRVVPVVILNDETAAVRGEAPPDTPVPALDGSRPAALLLEFTSLAEPPAAGARYRVSVRRQDDRTPAWEQVVTGADFRDNYTLLLSLPPGTLAPGSYRLDVTDDGGRLTYRSRFTVR